MNKPRIFISCVSTELKTARQTVANALFTLGYEPVWQDTFETAPGELLEMLRKKIDTSDGLIQLAGQAYGAEPPVPTEEFGRVSYTQFEFLYARSRKKNTWLIPVGDGCTKDALPDSLDKPRLKLGGDDSNAETLKRYQSERSTLQSAYLERLKLDNHLRHTVSDDKDLECRVLRLRDELLELNLRERRRMRRLLIISLVTLLILSGVSVGVSIALKGIAENSSLVLKKLEQQQREKDLFRYSSVYLGREKRSRSLSPEAEKELRLAALAKEDGATVEAVKKRLDESAALAIADPEARPATRALALMYRRDDSSAEKVAGEAADIALAQIGENGEKKAEALDLLLIKGKAQGNQGNIAGAVASYRTACSLVDKSDPILWTDAHARLAILLDSNSSEAFALWREIAALDYSVRGAKSTETLMSYSALITSSDNGGGKLNALEKARYEEVIAVFGKQNPDVVAGSQNTASPEERADAMAKISKLFTDTNRSESDPEVSVLMASSALLTFNGKFSMAEKAIQDYITSKKPLHGANSKQIAAAQFWLFFCANMAQEYKTASLACTEIASIFKLNPDLIPKDEGISISLELVFNEASINALLKGRYFGDALSQIQKNRASFGQQTGDLLLTYAYQKLGLEKEAAAFFDKVQHQPTVKRSALDPMSLNRVAVGFLDNASPDFLRASQASALACEQAKDNPGKKGAYETALNNLAYSEFHLGKKDESRMHFAEWKRLNSTSETGDPAGLALCVAQYETTGTNPNGSPPLSETRKILEDHLFSIKAADAAGAIDPLNGLIHLMNRSDISDPYLKVLACAMLANAYADTKLQNQAEETIKQGFEIAASGHVLQTMILRTATLEATAPYEREAVRKNLTALEAASSGNHEPLPTFLHKYYNALAMGFYNKKDFDLAERVFKISLPELTVKPEMSISESLISARSLANLLHNAKRSEEARKYIVLAVDLGKAQPSPDDLSIINDIELSAKLSTHLKLSDEEALLKDLLARKIKYLGADSERVAYTEITLAVCMLKQKRFEEAEKLSKSSLGTRLKLFKEPHMSNAESYCIFGSALARQGKFEEALTNLERASFNSQSSAGTDSAWEARLFYWKAKSMQGLHKDGADAVARKSLELSIAAFGEAGAYTIEAKDLVKAIAGSE